MSHGLRQNCEDGDLCNKRLQQDLAAPLFGGICSSIGLPQRCRWFMLGTRKLVQSRACLQHKRTVRMVVPMSVHNYRMRKTQSMAALCRHSWEELAFDSNEFQTGSKMIPPKVKQQWTLQFSLIRSPSSCHIRRTYTSLLAADSRPSLFLSLASFALLLLLSPDMKISLISLSFSPSFCLSFSLHLRLFFPSIARLLSKVDMQHLKLNGFYGLWMFHCSLSLSLYIVECSRRRY